MKKVIFLVLFFLFYFWAPKEVHSDVVGIDEPYNYKKMVEDLSELNELYGDALSIKIIGSTYFHKAIPAVKLGKGKDSILLIGTHHGREWITSNVNVHAGRICEGL